MSRARALIAASSGAALAVGLAAGAALGLRLDPRARAAASLGAPGPDFSAIARLATPAVVNISAEQVYRSSRSPFASDPFFREFFGRDSPFRVPLEERRTSLGSGVIVGGEGVIVTNNHVIEHSRQILITTSDHRRLRARLVGADPVTDIAVVKVEAPSLPTLPWGDSSRLKVGEYVLAVGNPFQLNQTVTMGIVSAVGRSNVGVADYEDFIQTDAAINPGNSGGALVDTRGQLIGINTAIYSETGGYQGIGFAVPANVAKDVVRQLLAKGRIVRGWTGIRRLADVGAATGFGQPAPGAVITEMLRRSPAERAGLLPGDVVVAVDGRPVEDAAQLRNELARAPAGSTLRLTVTREGARKEIALAVEEAAGEGA
jgi:serine protease Do